MSGADARELWGSADLDRWAGAMEIYPAVVAAQEVRGLEELDRWYVDELPKILAERGPAYVDREELTSITRWKMMRGEWRQRNLVLVRSNRDPEIRTASQEAFALVPDARTPIKRLSELMGVGAATASAVLGAYRGEVYPFLDELVGDAIVALGEPKFTVPYYLKYAAALRDRAQALGEDWTAQRVGLALWAASGGKAAM